MLLANKKCVQSNFNCFKFNEEMKVIEKIGRITKNWRNWKKQIANRRNGTNWRIQSELKILISKN